jgi:hypothetical protein
VCTHIGFDELAHARMSRCGWIISALHEHLCQLIYVGLKAQQQGCDWLAAQIDSEPGIPGMHSSRRGLPASWKEAHKAQSATTCQQAMLARDVPYELSGLPLWGCCSHFQICWACPSQWHRMCCSSTTSCQRAFQCETVPKAQKRNTVTVAF